MPQRWTIEQVVAIAPTPARFAAAEALAVPARWAALGADDRAVWGRCRGSGREPYDTMVDHAQVAWRCSCPSRSQPCKHALALLAMWVRGQVPRGCGTGAGGGLDRRGTPGGRRPPDPARRERRPPTLPRPPNPSRPPTGGRPGLSRNERVARLRDGLVELDRWLDDRLRTGLADPALARYATWDDLAARLVDARAGALANRVRRLAGVVGARPDWHEVVLAELGVLHLLARPGCGCPSCSSPLADAVATACGWQVRQADVLAGVPDTDRWTVAGRSDTREDRIEVRRTWLRGERSGRWAMVLSFAAYRQSLTRRSRSAPSLVADLHRYPGPSMRALARHGPRAGGRGRRPAGGHRQRRAATSSARCWPPSRGPTTSRSRVRAVPTVDGGRWVLTDDTGSLALAPRHRRACPR